MRRVPDVVWQLATAKADGPLPTASPQLPYTTLPVLSLADQPACGGLHRQREDFWRTEWHLGVRAAGRTATSVSRLNVMTPALCYI